MRSRGGSAASVCRDEACNYIGSSALVIEGSFDPATLEVVACREALSLAEDLHIMNFVVASDCRQVVMDINARSQGRYGAILRRCLDSRNIENTIYVSQGNCLTVKNLVLLIQQPRG